MGGLRRGVWQARSGELALGARDLALALPLVLKPHLHLARRDIELLGQLPACVEAGKRIKRVDLLEH